MKLMRKVGMSCLGLIMLAPEVMAQTELEIANYSLVSKQRVGRTDYSYTYKADVVNSGEATGNVNALLGSQSPYTRILDGDLLFGTVNAQSSVTSSDTFTIQQNRRYPFNPDDLQWNIQADSCETPLLSAPELAAPLLAEMVASISLPTCYSGTGNLVYHLVSGPAGMTINSRSAER